MKHLSLPLDKKKIIIIVSALISVLFITVALLYTFGLPRDSSGGSLFDDYRAPSPSVASDWQETERSRVTGDFYVSKDGSDDGDGAVDSPFLTIDRAIEAVKQSDKSKKSSITVCIGDGEYHTSSLIFDREAGGTENCRVTYIATGDNVIINGGVSLSSRDFISVEEYPEISERLSDMAKERVKVIDLTKAPYSLTVDELGKIYPIGTYNTANRYSGDTMGAMHSELFINGERCSPARYPDTGYTTVSGVISQGKDSNEKDEYGDPVGDILSADESLISRMAKWKMPEEVWVYGFLMYDWADGSSPIKSIDLENQSFTLKYQSFFGVKEGAPYYFFNCLEELNCEGEWYLDRESGLLCVFTDEDFGDAEISLSLSTGSLITINASNITLDGFSVKGTRGNGISGHGNGITVKNCTVTEIGGHGIVLEGSNISVIKNEVARTGRGGISVSGGDAVTLTPSNNCVYNNLVHDWSEIFQTYQGGISIGGVGNLCSGNELFNSPHHAITYRGNNNIIEYNLIYKVCLSTDDAGAIYAGNSWTSYGNHIRYNCIYDIGSDGHTPNGIYMDDALSGQKIYGNLLVNIPQYSIFVGGGRDMEIYGNVIVNPGEYGIYYDSRARDGALDNGWFEDHVAKDDGSLWQDLYNSPWRSELWQSAFPQYKEFILDFDLADESGFPPNPANSRVCENLIISMDRSVGNFDEAVDTYSTVSNNAAFSLFDMNSIFEDAGKGDYRLKEDSAVFDTLPDFENLQTDKIGRK